MDGSARSLHLKVRLMAEGMAAIVEELEELSTGKRRRILAQLKPVERRTVEALLRQREEPKAGEPVPALNLVMDELSPGLKAQVAERLQAESAELTKAGLEALRLALDTLARPDRAPASGAGPAKPSLLALIGRNLAGKRQRT